MNTGNTCFVIYAFYIECTLSESVNNFELGNEKKNWEQRGTPYALVSPILSDITIFVIWIHNDRFAELHNFFADVQVYKTWKWLNGDENQKQFLFIDNKNIIMKRKLFFNL